MPRANKLTDEQKQRYYQRDKERRAAKKQSDPDYLKKESERSYNSYWRNIETKRQSARESYYRKQNRPIPDEFRQYNLRSKAPRPLQDFSKKSAENTNAVISQPEKKVIKKEIPMVLPPPTTFNMAELFK